MVGSAAVRSSADGPVFVHAQRYAMGTMFDIAAYHPARAQAERAIEAALAEVVRLDHVLSHFDPESDLSKLVRRGRGVLVDVDPALYDVLNESMEISRRSGGSFDVTVGPLVRVWQTAQTGGQTPSANAIAKARRCVGFEKVQLVPPDRVQLASDCVSIDLGGIGKGYAVERAMQILTAPDIEHAVVNAGQSSIAAIGHPPDRDWLARRSERRRHRPRPDRAARMVDLDVAPGSRAAAGGRRGLRRHHRSVTRPAGRVSTTVIVRAASATQADALSTTLLLLPIEEGKRVLEGFPRASACGFPRTARSSPGTATCGAAPVKR